MKRVVSKRKIDYQKKDLKNPFFQKKKKRNMKTWLISIVIFVFVVIGIRFITNSSKFIVTNIIVTGNETISENEIVNIASQQLEKHRYFLLSQNNIFFFDTDKLEKEITQLYILEDVGIRKDYFNTIRIELKETITSLVWLNDTNAYYLDLKGIPFSEVKGSDENQENILRSQAMQQGLPIIYDQNNTEVKIGQKVISIEKIENILEINKLLAQNNIDIDYYQIDPEDDTNIFVTTLNGYKIYFSTKIVIISQINNLIALLSEKIENINEIEYIDLRYGKKVFYK
ncbi:FtsQ-type POTRA domain-containing protein [Patescibacteria group bacterium]|nr:FtsQ-type POTRA domain-containing protein [Patescibacteria group bacterium]